MLEIVDNEIKYKLGKNARENFELIDEAQELEPDYWWFHISDHPSGHCLVHSTSLTKEMILLAGNLVKSHSKLKDQKRVKIVYTQVKNIEKTKTMGQVLVSQSNEITL
jgi:predicted ribosome quality control (RQC) complex YloA/Tae2 family protein